MAFYVWPLGLPQKVRTDYSEDFGVNVLRSQPDAGPAKIRRRGKRASKLRVNFYMSSSQVELLKTFIEDTIKGVARFDFPHPRTNQIVEVRIVPTQDGSFFSLQYITPNYWSVGMELEVLP